MRPFVAAMLVALAASPSFAQQRPPAAAPATSQKTFASAADLAALVARLKEQRSANQPLVNAPLLQLASYTVSIEYRAGVGNAAVHRTEAELFYVLDGSATIVTGGELTEPQSQNAQNLIGKAIAGGKSQHVAKGDFVLVPEGTPHWFSIIDGAVTLMSLHLPRQP
jgi:hypothetical protein